MRGLVISTVAYFAATFFLKRKLDEMDVPRGMTRSIVIFVLAMGAAYGAAFLADLVLG